MKGWNTIMSEILHALNQLLNSVFDFVKEVSVPQCQESLFSGGALTMVGTIISGVIVFVACEWAREEWLTPYQEYRKIKSRIAYALEFYANCYTNVVVFTCKMEDYDKGREEMRKLACDLAGFMETVGFFRLNIPKSAELIKAHDALIGISNGFYCNKVENEVRTIQSNQESAKTIIKNLALKNVQV